MLQRTWNKKNVSLKVLPHLGEKQKRSNPSRFFSKGSLKTASRGVSSQRMGQVHETLILESEKEEGEVK
jgi:hypothetical protein